MKFHLLFATAVAVAAATLASPLAAKAQGIPDGVAHGVYEGNRAAGPIGAVVGAAVGGVVGGVEGVLGIHPTYAAYQEGAPRLHHHRRWVRHSYRHLRRRHGRARPRQAHPWCRIGYEDDMGKSTRAPIRAAGGIVIRNGAKPLVAIVQRRRDGAWVLPKGKLKPNEKPIAAAKREAAEETGCDVRVHEFLGVISYVGSGGPKIAHFWRMQALGGPAGKLADDIQAVEWLLLAAAIERLSLSHEQVFLRSVGRKALKRTLKEARIRPPAPPAALPLLDKAPPVAPAAAAAPPGAKPQPRWRVLARLSKRWQAAIGRTS